MPRESRKYLHDIRLAAARIAKFTKGCDYQRFAVDELLRSGVERQFEIIGEALAQLTHRDPATARRISEHRRIIAFRNILIHGYAEVYARWSGRLSRKVPEQIGEAVSQGGPDAVKRELMSLTEQTR